MTFPYYECVGLDLELLIDNTRLNTKIEPRVHVLNKTSHFKLACSGRG